MGGLRLTGSGQPVPSRRWWLLNLFVVALGVLLSVYWVLALLGRPMSGMRALSDLLLAVVLGLTVNRGLALWQAGSRSRLAHRILGAAKWLAPLVVPILLVRVVESRVQALQRAFITRELAPLVQIALARTAALEASQLPMLQIDQEVSLRLRPEGFDLWVQLPGLNLDGYTLVY